MNHSNQFKLKKVNIFSVDLEDYFMVSAFEGIVKREEWDRYESRVVHNTRRLLEILESSSPQRLGEREDGESPRHFFATFFCLGWIAERYPRLIKEIHSRGHEIASHGYDHRMITCMSPKEFREDIRKSKAILEDLTGQKVLGYRAPSYSITRKTLWALKILAEEGYLYDSSIFPIHHDRYGIPDAPRFPFIISMNGNQNFNVTPVNFQALASNLKRGTPPSSDFLIEFPIATVRFLGKNVPIGGGGYFRIFPLRLTQWALRRIQKEDCFVFVFYIHPWEIDSYQPKIKGVSFKSRFRHSINLRRTEDRLKGLLRQFSFSSFRDLNCQSCFSTEHV